MNFMKVAKWAIWLGALSLTASRMQAETWNKHWNLGVNPELRIHSSDASIEMEGTTGGGVDATLTTRGWEINGGGVRVIEHQSGETLDLEIKVPHSYFNFGERSVKLALSVPKQLRADIHTGDGSIRLTGIEGSIRAETGDGSVRGSQLEGSLAARTGDGSVHIEGRFDDLQLHTQDGSVEIRLAEGSKLRSGWRVETGDGSVHAALPGDLAADLELRTGDGHIQLDPAFKAANEKHGVGNHSEEDQSDHDMRSRLNGGGPSFVIRTGDGSITVTRD